MEYSSYYKDSFKRLKKNKMSMFCLIVIVLLILIAIFAPLIAPCDPNLQDYTAILQAPSKLHLLGTDEYGRDILSRIIYGTRVSLSVGILAQVIATIIGVTMGSLAAYYGGWVDTVLMRISDVFLAFPGLVFALAVAGSLGGGLQNAMIALAAISWPKYARIARSQTLSQKETQWMKAVRLSGSGTGKIILKHILPNILGPILVTSVLDIGTMMMELAARSRSPPRCRVSPRPLLRRRTIS